jgi:prolyl-tRNA editing enzyme YbaK/EbsC (Cys-tRNA(Pro) deacylase)
MTGTDVLVEALGQAGIAYELLDHAPTDRAADEAKALGLGPGEVAKTIVVAAGETNHRVVLLAADRIDLHKLRDVLESGKDAHLLTEDALREEYPEFELGAVPPLGGREDRVIVDRRVTGLERIVFEAGAHDSSVRIDTAALVAATGAQVADVSAD